MCPWAPLTCGPYVAHPSGVSCRSAEVAVCPLGRQVGQAAYRLGSRRPGRSAALGTVRDFTKPGEQAAGFLAWHVRRKRRRQSAAALRRVRARTWKGMTARACQPIDRARERTAAFIAPTERSARAERYDRARREAKATERERKKA
jgi:hypothetical protein